MDLISDSDGDEFEWDSDGDREAGSLNAAGSSAQASRCLNASGPSSTLVRLDSDGKKDSAAGPSTYMLDYFGGMGFSKELALKAMEEAGDGGEDAILDLLLNYKTFPNVRSFTHLSLKLLFFSTKSICIYMLCCEMQEIGCNLLVNDHCSGYVPHTADGDDDILENWEDDDAGDNRNKDLNSDDSVDEEAIEFMQGMSQRDKKIKSIVTMGFSEGEARMAITRCGHDADISVNQRLLELVTTRVMQTMRIQV
ncbi:unnamed protein product [Urochloa decumbens]|uniref:UBA domain-containing protein n=1 Tax=Urochloa decumbens TaxID=240449 RepID=A0ABC9AC41_9POAL